jgi:hypothetical protein
MNKAAHGIQMLAMGLLSEVMEVLKYAHGTVHGIQMLVLLLLEMVILEVLKYA